jgi:plasmid stability protein
LDDGTYERLKQQARDHGRSMESEARYILARATHGGDSLASMFAGFRGALNGEQLELPERQPSREVGLEW